MLVCKVLGRTVPEGGIPPQAGVLVQNVQTLMNVAAAVERGEPVIEKWVTVNGWVARPVQAAVRVGVETAGSALADQLVLPNVHDSLVPAISGALMPAQRDALGVLETFSCASIVVAADTAAKAAAIDLVEVRLARGLGGKCCVTLTGGVGGVKSAIAAAEAAVAGTGFLSGSVVIPSPHHSLWRHIL